MSAQPPVIRVTPDEHARLHQLIPTMSAEWVRHQVLDILGAERAAVVLTNGQAGIAVRIEVIQPEPDDLEPGTLGRAEIIGDD